VLLHEVERVADVVVVAVRDRDDVDALRLFLPLGALRVREPGVDVDPLPSRRVEAERGVAEPSQLNVRHLSPF
jgi:hypothetical protein